MGFRKITVKCLVLLAILIPSAPFLIAENGSNVAPEIPETREHKMTRYRLPPNTIPRLYNIHIEPDIDNDRFTWTGRISVDVEVVDPTPVLTLHAYTNLVVHEHFTNLVGINGTILTPIKHSRDNELEFLMLQFDRVVPAGNYSLNLKYVGVDTGEMVGFYKASYSVSGTNVAASYFEPTTARRAFPCWDEPGLKARFRVSIKHFPNYTAISNMPEVERVQTFDGKILTTFDTTPIMSTYLLVFVVGNYQTYIDEHRNVSLHTPVGMLEDVNHLLDLSPKVIEVMESYTGFPFGMPRIGSVVIPLFFPAAMEQWGLVSYSLGYVKINATLVETSRKDGVDLLIAHELVHSWFGNRVTALWWNDVWINEAFASYFQFHVMDEINENWGGLELFIVSNNQERAYPVDNDAGKPIRSTPITNKEINRMFGPITYDKGAAIIHMFRNVLGDDVFQAGIQKLMAKHSFGAVVTDDLIIAFQEAYDQGPQKAKRLNLKETLTPWLEQKGYPIVNVTRNYTTGDTEVSQKSTLLTDSMSSDKWWIPLTYATNSRPNFSVTVPTSWISGNEDFTKIGGVDKDDWIVLNVRASGYYRVNYDDENWNRLADYLNTDNYENIHVLNRAQLISDAFYLAQREPNRYFGNFYKLTKYLLRENQYLPWRSTLYAIKRVDHSLRGSKVHKQFQRYVLELMNSFIEKVGFEVHDNDDHFTKLSRTDVIKWACISGHPGCSEYAAQKLIKLVENPVENRLHPDTVIWTYCAGLRGLNDTAAKRFARWAYENEKSLRYVDDQVFLEMLDCTENHDIHRIVLDSSIARDSTAEMFVAYRAIQKLLMSTEENFNFTVDYFLENHQAMNETFSMLGLTNIVQRMVSHISEHVKTKARLEKFKEVMRLSAVLEDPEIPKTLMIAKAEKTIAKGDAYAALFLKVWDKQLTADNLMNGL